MMKENLLIIGAGSYALVAAEVAQSMGCFGKIAFIDDRITTLQNGACVVGTTQDIDRLAGEYSHIIIGIGNPDVRLSLLAQMENKENYQIATLISPHAYVSPEAKVEAGCIIEPMAVIHREAALGKGCIISAGAVVNHESACGEGVHIDCNATVASYARVPAKTKVCYGEVYKREAEANPGLPMKEITEKKESV